MKNHTPRYSTRQLEPLREADLDKTQSKFNRKQALAKEPKKKYRTITKEDQRICFMSPERISMLLTTNEQSFRSGKSPSVPNFFHSPPCLPEEESLIQNAVNETHDNCKMNDSLLSMYNELNLEKEEEILSLKGEIARLSQIIKELREEQVFWREKESEMHGLQEYLISRQTYICEMHEENVELSEKNSKLQKEKEMIYKQGEYLRRIFEKEKQQNAVEMKTLKVQLQTLKEENAKLQQENEDIRQELKQMSQSHTKNLLLKSQSLQNLRVSDDEDQFERSPEASSFQQQQGQNYAKNGLGCSLKLNRVNKEESVKKSYQPLLSSRSNGVRPREYDEDEELYKRSKISSKRCGCRAIIESLHQKIRYNEIQIDILKRVKAKGETLRTENDRLKKHNTTLLNRIDYLSERRKNQPKRRKDSDSSLELSLSPSHKNQRL